MKTFTVHYPPESGVSMTGLARDAILVKEGWCWPAFLIPFIWLLYNRMWIALAVYVAVELALAGIIAGLGAPDAFALVCSLAVSIILGLEGNNLYRWSLERRRYRQHAIITAANLVEAEHRFFSHAEAELIQGVATVKAGAAT